MNQTLINKISKMVYLDQKIRFNYPYKIAVLLIDFINRFKIKRIICKYDYSNKKFRRNKQGENWCRVGDYSGFYK